MSNKATKAAEAAVKAETVAGEKSAAVFTAKKGESLMYLGPSITGVIRHAEVYSDGLPETVQDCVRKCPVMERLFVTLGGIVDAQKQLRKETSALGAIYAQVEQKFARR